LAEVRRIKQWRESMVERVRSSDINNVDAWNVDHLWKGNRRRPINLCKVSPAIIGKRSELAEALGCDAIAGIALAIGILDHPVLPPVRGLALERVVEEFLDELRSQADLVEELAKLAIAKTTVPLRGPRSWYDLIEQDARTQGVASLGTGPLRGRRRR
jgi:hypothetical protein